MARAVSSLLLLCAFGCEPHVVDAVRESPEPPAPGPLETSLIHRYGFEGEGHEVRDSKGAAHGQLLGTALSGTGQLVLAGERSGQYVNLPNGIASGLRNATFEAWLTWDGGDAWQRIFDFGNSSSGQDSPGDTGTRYIYLTPASARDSANMLVPALHLAYSQGGKGGESICDAPAPFPTGVQTHVAVVIDEAAQSMAIYQSGSLVADCVLAHPLSAIDDVNNWLGHSNYVADVDLSGTFDEFRIYSAALTASELSASFSAGPDAGL